MEEKRDLKADLDWMFNAPSNHAKELEIGVHSLERAIKAEDLVCELVEALEQYKKWEAALLLEDRAWERNGGLPIFTQELYDAWMEIQVVRNSVLTKAEGVLGDE